MKNMAAAIDFCTSKIVTLIAETGNNHRCDIIGAGTVPYDGYMDGRWNVPERVDVAIRSSISEAEAQSGRHIKDVYVGVPGEFSRVYVTEAKVQLQGADPRVTVEDVNAVFQQATDDIHPLHGVIIHRSPAWFMVDESKKTMEPIGMKGNTLRAMVSFVVTDEFFLMDVQGRLRQMGLNVRSFYSSPTGEALLFLPPEDRDRTSILVDVGYLSTEVMAVEGDALVFHKVIPMGGANIALDVSMGLETTMSEAEQIKRSYAFTVTSNIAVQSDDTFGGGGFTHDQVKDVLEPRVEEIAELVKECIESSGVRLGNWSHIYLTGGGIALMNGGKAFFAQQLGRAVRAPEPRAAKLNSPIYASSLGLIDLVFDSLESMEASEGLGSRIGNFFKKVLRG